MICRSQYPTNLLKKKKPVRIKIRYLALKNTLFLVSTRNDNISRGCAKKMEFLEGRGGPFCEADFGKSRGEGGVIGKIPSMGGGVWIFSGTTQYDLNSKVIPL